jgi:hypothetical protein
MYSCCTLYSYTVLTLYSYTVLTLYRLDSSDTFRVVWADGDFPVAETGCGGGACTVRGSTCVCSTTLSEDAAFAALPSSRDEVISLMAVGAVDPTTSDSTYIVGAKNSEVSRLQV